MRDRLPEDVGIVVRDRKAEPLGGRYDICYVNGFQPSATSAGSGVGTTEGRTDAR